MISIKIQFAHQLTNPLSFISTQTVTSPCCLWADNLAWSEYEPYQKLVGACPQCLGKKSAATCCCCGKLAFDLYCFAELPQIYGQLYTQQSPNHFVFR